MGTEWVQRTKSLGLTVEHDVLDYGVHDYWTLHTFLTEAVEVSRSEKWYCTISKPDGHIAAHQSYTRFKKWWSTVERTQSHL